MGKTAANDRMAAGVTRLPVLGGSRTSRTTPGLIMTRRVPSVCSETA